MRKHIKRSPLPQRGEKRYNSPLGLGAFWGLLLLLLPFGAGGLFAQKVDMTKLQTLKPRNVGPAGMSGRVTAIDVVLRNTNIMYIGTASGGVWKSESAGMEWKPIFDKEKTLSIGAIAIHQPNPDVVWVGTGEGNPRNSLNSGFGVYRTLDGGRTWQCMGLEKTRNIHRIIIHPTNPDIVWVGAIGSPWGDSQERGVFKTTDAGKTWRKVLYVNEKTGVGDMILSPDNPNKLLVNMWEHRRQPWFFKSGGEGSGLYMSVDGGETWAKQTAQQNGLPEGELGRIGLTVCKSKPNVMYAIIEAKKNGFYRSDNGGYKWEKINDTGGFGDRPFYYSEIYVDPSNENRIFTLYSMVGESEDAGKTWKVILPYGGDKAIHPDHHAWWIHPENPNFMIDGNDGGMAITYDRGKTWRFVENLPVAQYYHIRVDDAIPYNIYGGMQDNGTWITPAYVWRFGGIRNSYSEEVCFGDGFDIMPDLTDSRYGYAMSQQGYLQRYDLKTGAGKLLRPTRKDSVYLRFNWNAALGQDPFDKSTIYYCSQFVHKSTDKGENWTIISPDLTTNDKEKMKQGESGGLTMDATGAENHCTILCLAPSPKQKDLLWASTDDGQLHLTQDAGKTWTNLSKGLAGLPAGSWIPQVVPSTHQAGEAFVVANDYRRENLAPYLYHTQDFGKTWKRIANESNMEGYTLAVVQDLVEPKLLFCGTDQGLYFSIDYGANWTLWNAGYPRVSTMDLAIQPREHDLIMGTFGRSAWVLDDIRPLRELAQKGTQILEKPIHAFLPPDAIWLTNFQQASGMRFAGNTAFVGENRNLSGAMLTFSIKEAKKVEGLKGGKVEGKEGEGEKDVVKAGVLVGKEEKGKKGEGEKGGKDKGKTGTPPAGAGGLAGFDTLKVTLEIVDANKQVIRTLKFKPKVGVNRVYWGLERKRLAYTPKSELDKVEERGGLPALTGTYMLRWIYDTDKDSTMLRVLPDPRETHNEANLKAHYAISESLEKKMVNLEKAASNLEQSKATLTTIFNALKPKDDQKELDEAGKALKKQGERVQDSIRVMLEMINGKSDRKGIQRSESHAKAKIFACYGYLDLSAGMAEPNTTLQNVVETAHKEYQKAIEKVNAFYELDWIIFKKAVEQYNLSIFKEYKPIEKD